MKLPGFDDTAKIKPTAVAKRDDVSASRMDFDAIPVIDIGAALNGSLEERKAVAGELRKAAHSVGFFYISNHGVAEASVEKARQAAETFYALPTEVKRRYDVAQTKRHRGYVPMGGLSADPTVVDLQEGYEVGLELGEDDPAFRADNPLIGSNVWPSEVPSFQPDVYAYFEDLMALGRRLYRLFALALDMPEDFFDDKVAKPLAQLRVMYYPETDPVENAVGIGAHTDYESFTVLWQSQPGLQVQNRQGEWIEATPIPGTFIINIADMMMRWTNDYFVSTPHRVINTSGKERISLALFFAADYDTVVECLPSCTDAENPPKYPPTHYGYWIENMHTFSYAYRWEERGKLPDPEEAAQEILAAQGR